MHFILSRSLYVFISFQILYSLIDISGSDKHLDILRPILHHLLHAVHLYFELQHATCLEYFDPSHGEIFVNG
jgi:hypothetical protein